MHEITSPDYPTNVRVNWSDRLSLMTSHQGITSPDYPTNVRVNWSDRLNLMTSHQGITSLDYPTNVRVNWSNRLRLMTSHQGITFPDCLTNVRVNWSDRQRLMTSHQANVLRHQTPLKSNDVYYSVRFMDQFNKPFTTKTKFKERTRCNIDCNFVITSDDPITKRLQKGQTTLRAIRLVESYGIQLQQQYWQYLYDAIILRHDQYDYYLIMSYNCYELHIFFNLN